MRTAPTTRELCDNKICRSASSTPGEMMLAQRYRELHEAARLALVALKSYAEDAPEGGAVREVIDDLEQQLNR